MRRKYKADAKKRFSYLVTALLIGFAMGLLAKLVDNPRVTGIVPVFDDLGGRLGIWIFTATLLAVFCNSPGMAAIRTFIYFMSFLFTYYAYTVLFLGFFPKSQILFWGLCALVSPLCAFLIWFARGKGWFSNFLISLPIAVLAAEVYMTGKGNLVLQIIYFCMCLCLLLVLPKKRIQCAPVLLITFLVFFVLIKLDILTIVFGNWML